MPSRDRHDPYPCQANPDLFFPAEQDSAAAQCQIAAAKRACRTCPVMATCRRDALDRREPTLSVVGGLLFPRPRRAQVAAEDPEPRKIRSDAVPRDELVWLRSFGYTDAALAARFGVTIGAIQRSDDRANAKRRAADAARIEAQRAVWRETKRAYRARRATSTATSTATTADTELGCAS